jgi:hypothetical protein
MDIHRKLVNSQNNSTPILLQQQQHVTKGNASQYGITKLPNNVETCNVEFDIGITKGIDTDIAMCIVFVIEYCCYTILDNKTEKASIHIMVAKAKRQSATSVLTSICHEVVLTVPITTKIHDKYIDYLRLNTGYRVRQGISFQVNLDENVGILRIPVGNHPLPGKTTLTNMHFFDDAPIENYGVDDARMITTYHNNDGRGNTKRRHIDLDK